MLTDPIADMLTRIRNANKALHETAEMPTSRQKEEIARLLQDEGYIVGFQVVSPADHNSREPDAKKHRSYGTLVIQLKYGPSRERIITDLKRVSKPGRRVYMGVRDLPQVRQGLGVSIVSTPRGVMSDAHARAANVGGEVLCTVF